MSSTELTFQKQAQINFINQENKKLKRPAPRGLDYFKNLERKNKGPETKKQAELSSVLTKLKPNQNQKREKTKIKPEINTKPNKIDKYLVKLKPEQDPQPTNLTTTPQKNPDKLSLLEKIKKFSSKSPPKLPPTTNRSPEPNPTQKTKPTKHQQGKETNPNGQNPQNQTTTPPNGTKANNNKPRPSKPPTTNTTTKMEAITTTRKQQTNKNNTTTTDQKPKPAKPKPNKTRNHSTANKSQDQPDIKLFLAQKKIEIKARAAAKLQPTQVRVKCNLPCQDVTSASSSQIDEPGGIATEGRPNQMTL